MNKIFSFIIIINLFFSISYNVYANEGYIESTLNLNYGYEEIDIDLFSLDKLNFSNQKNINMFNNFNYSIELLRSEIIRKYKNGDFDYYQTKGIIANYKNFVYYTNMFFFNLRILELNPGEKDAINLILDSYNYMRSYYSKMKSLIYS